MPAVPSTSSCSNRLRAHRRIQSAWCQHQQAHTPVACQAVKSLQLGNEDAKSLCQAMPWTVWVQNVLCLAKIVFEW